MSILIKKSDVFPIKVIIGVENTTPKKYYCCSADNATVAEQWPTQVVKQEHSFTFRELDFRTNSIIVDRSVVVTDKGVRVNGAAMRLNRLLTTLSSWTLLDDDGTPAPLTEESAGTLPPEVASILMEELDKSQAGI